MLNHIIQWLESSQAYIQSLGILGVFAYAGIFVVAQMFLIPGSPIALAGGYFFGFAYGLAGLTLGTTVGAAVNFLISRYVARGYVLRKFGGNEKFRLIDEAIGRKGWKIIALLRFAPIPFGLANYCYGITSVKFVPYILATFFTVIPANAFFTWTGHSSKEGLDVLLGKGRPRHPMEYVLLGVGIIAAFLALRYVAKIAQEAINEGRTKAQD